MPIFVIQVKMLISNLTPWMVSAIAMQVKSSFGTGPSHPYHSPFNPMDTNNPIPLFIPYPFKSNAHYPNNLNSPYNQHDTVITYPGPLHSRYDWPPTTTEDGETASRDYYYDWNNNDNGDEGDTGGDDNGGDAEASTASEQDTDPENDFIETLEAFFIVKPAVSAMISLLNLVSIIMLALGAEVKIVGKRSSSDFERSSSQQLSSLAKNHLVLEGLKLGSNGTSHLCVQRAACEVPRRATLFVRALDFMSHLTNIDWM